MKTFKQAYKGYSLLRSTNAAHLQGTTRVSILTNKDSYDQSTLSE